MKKLILLSVLTFLSTAAFADIIPLKKDGDYAMIENPEEPGAFQEIYVMYIENDMARVRGEKQTAADFFDEMWLATVPVASLIHPVDSMNEFKLGDKVCLKKSIKTFKKGFCSKVHRIYENGSVLLWKGIFTSDVLATIEDIQHKQ